MSAVVNTSRAISTEELDGDDEFPKSVHKKQKTIAEIQYAKIASFDFLDDDRVGSLCQGSFWSVILHFDGLNS